MLWSIANVSTWTYTGYNMIIFYAALRAIPAELYEAAAVDGAGAFRTAIHIKLPLLRPAILLCGIFSVIGSFQLFAEPQIFFAIAPDGHRQGLHAEPVRLQPRVRRPAAQLRGRAVVHARARRVRRVVPGHVRVPPAGGTRMSAFPPSRPTRASPPSGQGEGPQAFARSARAGAAPCVPTLFMLAFLVYFLMPLGWLFIASTKSLDDLFSSFGLWFADFNLVDNIRDTFTKDDGVYWDVDAQHADVLVRQRGRRGAAGGGRGLRVREVRVPGQEPAVLVRAGLGDGPDDGARDPDVPDVRRARVHEQPAVGHPAVAGQPVRDLPDAHLRGGLGAVGPDRGGADRRRG